MSTVVSDASPLINLARVEQFDLLRAFYGQLLVPQAVYDEVVVQGYGRDGCSEVQEADWIVVVDPEDDLAVRTLAAELGAGEAAAIILAQERQATLVLMDEIRGRRIVERLGLKARGTLGILIRAKAEGRLPSLIQVMDLLRARGTWIGDDLYEDVLRRVGEIV
jgi:predicted nucleic acid-binding protein